MCGMWYTLHCVWLLGRCYSHGFLSTQYTSDSQLELQTLFLTDNLTPPHTFRRLLLNTVTLSDGNLISSSFCQLLKTHSTVQRHYVLGDPYHTGNPLWGITERQCTVSSTWSNLAQWRKDENFGNKGNIQNNSQTTGNIKVSTCLQDDLVAHIF